MKLALAAAVCALNLATVEAAWANSDEKSVREERIAEVRSRLNLSEEQMKQVRPVLQEAGEAQRTVLKKYGIDLDAENSPMPKLGMRDGRKMRGELQKVQADTMIRLEGILTPQQLKDFQTIQQERSEAMRKRIRGGI